MIYNLEPHIFKGMHQLKDFIVENSILPCERICESCNGFTILTIYKQGSKERLIYRCSQKGCQKKKSIIRTNLCIKKYITIIYFLMSNCNYWQLYIWKGVTNETIFRLKKKLRIAYRMYMDANPVFLGGPQVVLEVDETVLSRRGTIVNPTSTSDNYIDTVWILGVVDPSDKKVFSKKS